MMLNVYPTTEVVTVEPNSKIFFHSGDYDVVYIMGISHQSIIFNNDVHIKKIYILHRIEEVCIINGDNVCIDEIHAQAIGDISSIVYNPILKKHSSMNMIILY